MFYALDLAGYMTLSLQ